MKFWIDKGGFIYLFQILKAAGAIQEYREVSLAIKHGQVSVNDETCFKQRRVLKVDDTVRYKKLHKVKKETLKKHGAVSKETALEMASNAAKLFAADIAGSVTGIAGPDGGTDKKN